MSFAVIAGIVIAGLVSLAVCALVLVRRRLRTLSLDRHNTIVGHMYAVLGAVYGVLLAFVVGTVWERYVEAGEIVEREANALVDLYRTAAVYPEPMRRRVRAELKAYARLVPQEEWSGAADGVGSDHAWHTYGAIWREYLAYSPVTMRQRIWHMQSVEQLNALGDARQLRLLHSQQMIPALLWIVLGTVGIVTVAFAYLFEVQNEWLHALITGTLAGAIGLVLLLLMAMEHPFDGLARVEPQAFREALEIMQR